LRPPSLRTGQADFPHPALQLVVHLNEDWRAFSKVMPREHALKWMMAFARQQSSLPRLPNSGRFAARSILLFHAPEEKSPIGLALRHSHWWLFCVPGFTHSTSLRSLRSIPVTGFPRYYGRSDSCPAGSSVAWTQHEHRLCPEQVSLLHATDHPIPPSPTTPLPPDVAFARYPSARQVSRFPRSRFHLSLAGSPGQNGRIEFVILRMDRSPPAAPHPASRRRSCSRLQVGERIPGEDSHLSDQLRLQAHECGDLSPLW
jgi:hypothetical protein